MNKVFILSLLLLLCVSTMHAQGIKVHGTVVSGANGEPLIGVSVVQSGNTSNGTVTDLDGRFMLTLPADATLSLSYLGFQPQEIKVNGRPQIRVTLAEAQTSLDEVVVVGYGTQKKVNLSGAVSAIDGKQIAQKPASDAVSALQGEMLGLTILRSSGQPGSETSGMRVRGFSSVNSTSTLVLIDGVEGDLGLVNADDIESVSVLKDAAASAIYGARAAAGVILVTTKNGGEGKTRVNYNGYLAVNTPGNMPERLPAWEEQRMINEGRVNYGGKPEWNDEMSLWVANPNFNYRPNNTNGRWDLFEATNWVDEGTKDHTFQQNHSLSVSGGGKNLNYMISGNYYYKNGMLKYADNNNTRVSILAKINAELNKYVTLRTNIQYQSKQTNYPSNGAGSILNLLYSSRGRQPIYTPTEDLNYDSHPYNGDLQANGIDIEKNAGTNSTLYESFIGKGELNIHNFVKGLSVNLSASRRAGYYSGRAEYHTILWYDRLGSNIRSQYNNPNSLYRIKNNDYHDLFEATVNYEFLLNKAHNFKLLLGSSYENYRKDQMDATAKNMNSNEFYAFGYYDTSVPTNTILGDNISPWSMMSYFGRFNYNYKERYLFEANVRRDGSSRLAPEKRWKTFPSLSAAWRVNQEPWFKVDAVSNLKLRASWGELGNGAVLGFYDYIATISQGASYMGEKSYYQGQLASSDKTWETIKTTNIGIDLGLLNNRLTTSFDYYWKINDDMLSRLQLPHTIGIGVPAVNVGKLKTWGWDFEVKWNDKIRDFNYQVSFNLSDSQNRLEKYDGSSSIWAGTVGLLEGYELNTIWGYTTDGYWSSADEYTQYKADHPGYKTFNDGKISGGDVRYVALGQPDHQVGAGQGTKEDHGDLVYLGNTNARYLYGFTLSAQWKGFDISVMFQGVGKRKMLIDAAALAPFYQSYQMPWTIHRDYWTPDNQDAYWPRLANYAGNDFNFKPSDRWVQDASYMRLKNLTLGYTVPLRKTLVNRLRFYITGEDIWEHSDLLKVFDPEAGNQVGRDYYPFFRTWSFGVNISL